MTALTCENNIDLMARFPENHFDLAIVDPPYFDGPNKLGYYGSSVSKVGVIRDGYDKIGNWKLPDENYFKELFRVSKHQIIWGCNYFPQYIPNNGRIVWDKCNGDSSFSDAEIASCSLHDSVRLFRYMWNGMMQGKSITEGHVMQGNKKLNEKRIHATQKPVLLYKWILLKYAQPGFKILDTHMGSGSSVIACEDFGFDITACEIDPVLYKKAVKRININRQQFKLQL